MPLLSTATRSVSMHYRRPGFPLAALVFLAGSAATAQSNGVTAGLGRETMSIDVEGATGTGFHLGVEYVGGVIWTSARNPVFGAGHGLFAFDAASGAPIDDCVQPVGTELDVWGIRDLATDGVSLMGGLQSGIWVMDLSTCATGAPIGLATTVIADNGPQTLNSNPILGPGLAAIGGTYRGLAFDPSGDGGNGSFWTANFSSDLVEIDLDGNVLTTHSFNGRWSIYGLALDPITGMLWASSSPNEGNVVEIDPATGAETGLGFPLGEGLQGGLGCAVGGLDGRSCGADLVGLLQSAPDTVFGYRLHLWDAYTASQESSLSIGVDGVYSPGSIAVPFTASSIDWDLDAVAGTPYTAFIDFEPMSLMQRPVGPLLPVAPFLRSMWEFRRDIGTPVFVPGLAGMPVSVASSSLPVEEIAIQAVYLDANALDPACSDFGLNASDERRWVVEPPPSCARFEANGANSFNSVTTSGFWSCRNFAGQDIVSLTVDFSINLPGQEFDTDQGSMADNFQGGNSTAAGCLGTYRNGSEQLTGLVFAGTQVSTCDATALTGWIASNPLGSANDFATLTFTFSDFNNGEVFEFDADTDGGAGIRGGSMAGAVITIQLADGTVCTGAMLAESGNPNRSLVDI